MRLVTLKFVPAPAWLIFASIVPIGAGLYRFYLLATPPADPDEFAHFRALPWPLITHIVTICLFLVLGAFQFVPRLRKGKWHKIAGRIAVSSAAISIVIGIWISFVYPTIAPSSMTVNYVRIGVGVFMGICLIKGVFAIRARQIGVHRAWMIRLFALALGPSLHAVMFGLAAATLGGPTQTFLPYFLATGWGITLIIAEFVIHRPSSTISNRSPA